MIRYVEGFDLTDFSCSGLPYIINSGIFAQGQMITGQTADGRSWWIFNTGFGEADYTRIIDSQSTWIVNIFFRPLTAATGSQTQVWRDVIFFRMSDTSGVIFDLHQHTDGTIDFRDSTGAILFVIPKTTVGEWNGLQIKTSGSGWEIRSNGVTLGSGTDTPIRPIDRFTFRWTASAGLNLDHYVINDGQGSVNNDILPYPWRVTSYYPLSATKQQWTAHIQTDPVKAVYDHLLAPQPTGEYPDGDLGYITPTAASQDSTYEIQAPACFGRILGIAINVCAKPNTGAQSFQIIGSNNSTHVFGTFAAVSRTVQIPGRPELVDYITYQAISETNPETGLPWTDGDLDKWSFGVRSVDTDLNVTQIFISKVTTTKAGVSFDCGGVGSYAY